MRHIEINLGLGATMFGLGLASLLGQSYAGKTLDIAPKLDIAGLSDLPVVGPLLFSHDPLIYLSIVAVIGVWWFLNRTRAGLNLRAVGENHDAAHAIGYSTALTAACAIIFFWARVAHAIVFIAGVKQFMARTVLFTISWAAFIIFALALVQQAVF